MWTAHTNDSYDSYYACDDHLSRLALALQDPDRERFPTQVTLRHWPEVQRRYAEHEREAEKAGVDPEDVVSGPVIYSSPEDFGFHSECFEAGGDFNRLNWIMSKNWFAQERDSWSIRAHEQSVPMLVDLAWQWGFEADVEMEEGRMPMIFFSRFPYRPGEDCITAGLLPSGDNDGSCD